METIARITGLTIDLNVKSGNLSERLLQAEKKGIQVSIDRLRLEVVEYDNLKQQKEPIQISSILQGEATPTRSWQSG
jgi:hypothetical protein